MKKITTLLILLLVAGSAAFAQQPANLKVHGAPVKISDGIRVPHYPRLRNKDFSIALDYDVADAQNYQQGEYLYFVWNSNMYYSLAANDPIDSNGMNYCVVAFDTLVDAGTLTPYPRNQVVGNMTVDTIQALVSHVNYSGNPDTITVSIVQLNGLSALWSSNIITDTSLSVNGFNHAYTITVPANFTLPAGSNTFGVMLQYYGDKRDTFAYWAGFGDQDLAGCGTLMYKATQSAYYPTSYAYWVYEKQLIPNTTFGDFYYDCNQNHQYDAGIDGANYMQNISILADVSFTSNLGVNDINGNASVLNVYPNPAKDQSTISYSVKSSTNVTFNIYDVTGQLVQSINKGTVAPGKYTQAVDLSKMASGIYSFSINTTEGRSFGKIAVTK